VMDRTIAEATVRRVAIMLNRPENRTAADRPPPFPFTYAIAISWFFSGNERIRLPVAR
jgi:hypothetical protein